MTRTGTTNDDWAKIDPRLARKSDVAKTFAQPTSPKPKRTVVPRLKPPERAGDVILIWLPLPHAQLHKNGGKSTNRGWVASLTRAAHNAAHLAAWLVRFPEPPKAVRIDWTFRMGRKRDDDGLIHWVVPYRDGIAKALGCNDGNFTTGTIRQLTGAASEGRREVELCITRLA